MLRRFVHSTFGLVSFVGVGFAAAILGIGVLAYELTHEAVELQLDHRIATETRSLLEEAREDGLTGVADSIRRRTASRSSASLDYLLVNDLGEPLAGTITAQVPKTGYEEFFAYRRGEAAGVAQAFTTPIAGGTLIVAADRADLYELDAAVRRLFGWAGAGVLVASLLAAFLIAWLTRRRLSFIDQTARAITAGDHSRRVPRDGSGSEFDCLAETLNDMLDRNAALLENLRQVSSDVAHDLRTPLTRLCARLETALSAEGYKAQAEAIVAAREQAGELLEIFAALLRISEIEAKDARLKRESVDLSALVEQMGETYQPDFEASGRQLEWQVPPGLTVPGDSRLLSQALSNLLDNILRHARPGANGWIVGREQEHFVALTVCNDGHTSDDIEGDGGNLFRRFTRSDQSRTENGHGLGLALVSAIAEFHGGKAKLDTSEGFQVRMTLTRAGSNLPF